MEVTKKVISDLDNELYHNSTEYAKWWSSSNLKPIAKYSPLRAKFEKDSRVEKVEKAEIKDTKESKSLRIGRLFHDYMECIQKGTRFFDIYEIFHEPVNEKTGKPYGKNTNTYKDAFSLCVNPISQDEVNIIKGMHQALKQNTCYDTIIVEALENGTSEESSFVSVEIAETFEKIYAHYKTRKDLSTDKIIFDYKSISNDKFTSDLIDLQIKSFMYHFSAAMYQWVECLVTGVWKPFYLIWVTNDEPYQSLVMDISNLAYHFDDYGNFKKGVGAELFENVKYEFEQCVISGNFAGLEQKYAANNSGERVAIPSEPRFIKKFEFTEQ